MGEFGSSFFAFRFLPRLGLAWAQAISSSIRPLFPFITGLWADQYSCRATPLLLPCYYLTCACWASFRPAMYFSFIQFTLPSISAGLNLILFWTSSAHFIPLGVLGLLQSFRHPWPIPFLYSHGLLLNLLGFPGPITISFTFSFTNSFLWTPPTHFCLLSISYNSHGLTTFFSGLPWACLFSLGHFLLFYRHVDHYSYHSSLIFFSYFANSSFFTLCYIIGIFLAIGPFLFCQNGPQQLATFPNYLEIQHLKSFRLEFTVSNRVLET